MPVTRSFVHGLILSAFATAVSLAVGLLGFRRMYYFGALLPVFMVFYVLIAWLIYLKKTSFRGFRTEAAARPGDEIAEDKISGAELLNTREEDGLVRRRPTLKDNRVEGFLKNPTPALLWSACQLAILATALYHLLGVGASY